MVYTGCGNGNCGLTSTVGLDAFWRAAYGTDVEAMKLLVKYGADPNIPTMTAAGGGGGGRGGGGGGGAAVVAARLVARLQVAAAPRVLPVRPVAPGRRRAAVSRAAARLGSRRSAGASSAGRRRSLRIAAGACRAVRACSRFTRRPASSTAKASPATRIVTRPTAGSRSVKYLVEELGADVNQRDDDGYTPLHHAAARGDNELILYLVSKGADVNAVSRRGQTTADMANGPVSRISPFPETIALLEKLGSKNNHKCASCTP